MALLEEKDWPAWLVLKDRTAVTEAGRRTQTPELRVEPPEVVLEITGLESGTVRFEPFLMLSRLRTGEWRKGETRCLLRSFQHPVDERCC